MYKKLFASYTIKICTITLIIFSGLALTGCGTSSNNKVTSARPTSTKEKITLNIWSPVDDKTAYDEMILGYQSAHPNVTINFVNKDLADYETQSLNALAQGSGPDIWVIPNVQMPRHYQKLIPIPDNFFNTTNTKIANADYFKKSWAPVTYTDNVIDGKVYGVPLYVDTLALYVNTQLWDAAHSAYRKANATNTSFDDSLFRHGPVTWNEFLAELPYLTIKDGANIKQAGAAVGTSLTPNSVDLLSLLMIQNGATMIDPSEHAARFNTFRMDQKNNPIYKGTFALQFFTSFSDPSKSTYTWSDGMGDPYQSFMNGKTAMLFDYETFTQTLKQKAPTLPYTVYAMPQVKDGTEYNYASYWTTTVTNNCKHPDVAWDFLTTLASHPTSYDRASKRTSALYTNEQYTFYDVFLSQVMTATNWNKGKYPERVDAIMKELINSVAAQHLPAQSSIDSAATSVTELLQKE